jgi:drug/metabolite transporter (DMT)-like permease
MTLPAVGVRAEAEAPQHTATAAGLAALLLWSGLATLTAQASGVPRFELLAVTFGVAFVAGTGVLALRGDGALRQMRQPLAPWLAAFSGLFLYHVLYFYALSAAPPAQASLLSYLWPLLIVLLSSLVTGQSLRARHLASALLGLAGTVLVVLDGGRIGSASGTTFGYAAAAGSAVVWAAYSVSNRLFRATPSAMIVGVCGAVAVSGAVCHLALEPTIKPDTHQCLAMIALGLGPVGLAFLAWDHATKRGNLPLLGALSYLAPLLSTLMLIATGHAAPTPRVLLAAVLVMTGAVLATRGNT